MNLALVFGKLLFHIKLFRKVSKTALHHCRKILNFLLGGQVGDNPVKMFFGEFHVDVN